MLVPDDGHFHDVRRHHVSKQEGASNPPVDDLAQIRLSCIIKAVFLEYFKLTSGELPHRARWISVT
jgi:hypothetical protein